MNSIKITTKKAPIILFALSIILSLSNLKVSAQSPTDNFTRELAIGKMVDLGMTIDEAEHMSDEDLKVFYNANQVSWDKRYYYVPEDESKMPVLITEKEMLKAVEQKEYLNNVDNISTFGYEDDTQVSSGGYLEQYVSIADSYDYPGRHYISYRASWLIQPLNRKIDVFGVAVSNATVVPGSASTKYDWVIDRYYNGNYQPNWSSATVDLKSSLKYDAHGVATKCKLMTDTLDGIQQVVSQNMYLSFYVTKDNPNISTIGVAGNYMHQEAVFSVSPSITAVDFTVGISITSSDKFTTMLPNPYTVLYE